MPAHDGDQAATRTESRTDQRSRADAYTVDPNAVAAAIVDRLRAGLIVGPPSLR